MLLHYSLDVTRLLKHVCTAVLYAQTHTSRRKCPKWEAKRLYTSRWLSSEGLRLEWRKSSWFAVSMCACAVNSNLKTSTIYPWSEMDFLRSCLLVIVVSLTQREAGALWWPFSIDEADDEPTAAAVQSAAGPVAFEMATAEQKFLAEAQQYLNLPPLEACQHKARLVAGSRVSRDVWLIQVVHELRQSCGLMAEEELGKMAVDLLNCQSQAEDRATFTCTEDMVRSRSPHIAPSSPSLQTLAECTAGMDATVWNAYHIISNRARSVCYSTRQQQFRTQTEAVVNKLSSSSLQQIQVPPPPPTHTHIQYDPTLHRPCQSCPSNRRR